MKQAVKNETGGETIVKQPTLKALIQARFRETAPETKMKQSGAALPGPESPCFMPCFTPEEADLAEQRAQEAYEVRPGIWRIPGDVEEYELWRGNI